MGGLLGSLGLLGLGFIEFGGFVAFLKVWFGGGSGSNQRVVDGVSWVGKPKGNRYLSTFCFSGSTHRPLPTTYGFCLRQSTTHYEQPDKLNELNQLNKPNRPNEPNSFMFFMLFMVNAVYFCP